jgi:hypothetical protein
MDCIDFIEKVEGVLKTENITILILSVNNIVSGAFHTTSVSYYDDLINAKLSYQLDVIDFDFEKEKLLIWARRRIKE